MATSTKPLINVKDYAEGVNDITSQLTGKTYVDEVSANMADFGKDYADLDSETKHAVTSGLVTMISKQITTTELIEDDGLDLVRSTAQYQQSWGILQKNRIPIPEAVANLDVYNPQPNSTIDQFKALPVTAKTEYFMNPFSFAYEWTEADRWLGGLFTSEQGFSEFWAAVRESNAQAINLNLRALKLSALRASIGLNLFSGGARSYNVLELFNAGPNSGNTPLTVENFSQSPGFWRFYVVLREKVQKYMQTPSAIYNEKGWLTGTSAANTQTVSLNDAVLAARVNMESDTFHKELVSGPATGIVASWKGLLLDDTEPTFESVSTVADELQVAWEEAPVVVQQTGVLSTSFDKRRVGIERFSHDTVHEYNRRGRRTNYWTDVYAEVHVDPYYNGVTFFVADPEG